MTTNGCSTPDRWNIKLTYYGTIRYFIFLMETAYISPIIVFSFSAAIVASRFLLEHDVPLLLLALVDSLLMLCDCLVSSVLNRDYTNLYFCVASCSDIFGVFLHHNLICLKTANIVSTVRNFFDILPCKVITLFRHLIQMFGQLYFHE